MNSLLAMTSNFLSSAFNPNHSLLKTHEKTIPVFSILQQYCQNINTNSLFYNYFYISEMVKRPNPINITSFNSLIKLITKKLMYLITPLIQKSNKKLYHIRNPFDNSILCRIMAYIQKRDLSTLEQLSNLKSNIEKSTFYRRRSKTRP